jgi:hypothetical protein
VSGAFSSRWSPYDRVGVVRAVSRGLSLPEDFLSAHYVPLGFDPDHPPRRLSTPPRRRFARNDPQGTFRRLVIDDGETPPPPSETPGADARDDADAAASDPSAAAALAARGIRATYDPDEAAKVRVDAATAASLHLVRGDGGGGDASLGSLLAFLDDTTTHPGRRRLREWILAPLRDAREITRRLDALDALRGGGGGGGGAGAAATTILEGVRRALRAIPCDAQRGTARAVALDEACARASEAALARGAAPPSDVAAVIAGAGAAAAAAAVAVATAATASSSSDSRAR